jgi:dUTP pyrophosphatase
MNPDTAKLLAGLSGANIPVRIAPPPIPVVRLHPDARLPSRATPDAAGLDLYAVERVLIPHGSRSWVRTGVAMSIPRGFYGKVESRSSFAGAYVDTRAGVIDSDYRGEIGVLLAVERVPGNSDDSSFVVNSGMKIAQLIIHSYSMADVEEVTSLDQTERGEKGFGSSGV